MKFPRFVIMLVLILGVGVTVLPQGAPLNQVPHVRTFEQSEDDVQEDTGFLTLEEGDQEEPPSIPRAETRT